MRNITGISRNSSIFRNKKPTVQERNYDEISLICKKIYDPHRGFHLVGWFQPTPLKNMLVKMGSSSPYRGENNQIFELPPPSYIYP